MIVATIPNQKSSVSKALLRRDAGVTAAVRAASGCGYVDPEVVARHLEGLAAIDTSRAWNSPRADAGIEKLSEAFEAPVECHGENVPAWSYLESILGPLNELVEGLCGGFGDFEALMRPDGVIVFSGEPAGSLPFFLHLDQDEILAGMAPVLPSVFIIFRDTGEVMATRSLSHAAEILVETREAWIECAEVTAWCARRERRRLKGMYF